MPKKRSIEDLPDSVKNVLPKHAEKIFQEAYNNALEQYKDPQKRRENASLEETAHKVAWAAVKQQYEKNDQTGKWEKK